MSDPRVQLVHRIFSGTGLTCDHIVNLFSLGFDGLWKRRILEKIPARPHRIIDLACGTGILTFRIAREFPKSHVVEVELRDEYLHIAREKRTALGIVNVEFMLGRAEDVFLEEPLDCITASYLAKYAEMVTLIANAGKMLRRGGLLPMHDFTYPSSRFVKCMWEFYFKLMQTAGAWKYPEWATMFFELPEIIRNTRWVTDMVQLLRENSFSNVTCESLTLGTSAIVAATR